MTELINSPRALHQVDGEAYVTRVTLSAGTATLTWTDVAGIDTPPAEEPFALATGPGGNEAISAKGTTQCTVTGSTADTVEVLIVIPTE